MKKIISIFLTLTLMMGMVVTATATVPAENVAYSDVVYSHDFSKTSYDGLRYPSGTAEVYKNEGVAKSVIPATDADGNMSETYFRFGNNLDVVKNISSNMWKVDADVSVETLVRFQFGIWLTNSSGSADKWLVPGTFHHDGKFYDLNGDVTYSDYAANTPMHLEIYYNNSTGAYSMYVNGSKITEGINTNLIGAGGIYCGSIALTTTGQPASLETGKYVIIDNVSISAYNDYGYDYKDDAGYNKVIFSDDFDNGIDSDNKWYLTTSGGANGTKAEVNSLTNSNAAYLTGNWPRLFSTRYTVDGKKLMIENYTTDELKRVRIKMDMCYTYTGTTTSQLTVTAYNAYTAEAFTLFKFNNNNPIWHPFNISDTTKYNYGTGEDQVGAGEKNKNYTITIYLDTNNHKGTIMVDDNILIEDYDLTQVVGYNTSVPRIDVIKFEQGTVPEKGTYIDNFEYAVQVPEIKIAETGNTAGTVTYNYCPDLLNGNNDAFLILAIKKGGVLSNVIPTAISATKLKASDVTTTGSYRPTNDTYITARYPQSISVNYTKAADEEIEVYLWEQGTLKPLRAAVK